MHAVHLCSPLPLARCRPPPHTVQLTAGLGLEVRLDAGDGKGKGIFACQAFQKGQVLFTEAPLAAIQHTTNRPGERTARRRRCIYAAGSCRRACRVGCSFPF